MKRAVASGPRISEATIRAEIGDTSGQVAVGNHIVQVGSHHGDLVVQQRRRPTVEVRPRPVERPPSAFPDLLGRDPEVASAVAALEAGRGTGFHGVNGVGKSSILRHVAHHPAVRVLPDGVLYCPGRGRPIEDLLQLIFDGFYDAEMGFTPTPGQVHHYLGSLRALLVVDDIELSDQDVGVLADTLPGCTFLLTSETRRMWEPGRSVSLRGLPEAAALLLLERELDRPLTAEEEEPARGLCRAVGGHPRRLVQAAYVVVDDGRTLAEVAEVAAEAGTERAEEGVVRLALAGLTARERDVLALIAAVEPAPLHVDRVVALTAAADSSVPLEALLRRGLVKAHSPRYSVTVALPPEERAERDRWADLAIEHYLTALDGDRARPDRFDDDVDAIRALVQWSGDQRRWDDVVQLARKADPVLAMARRWTVRDDLLNRALAAASSSGDRAAQAWSLHQLGTRALGLGDEDTARRHLGRALELRTALGDRVGADLTRFHLDQLSGPPPSDPGGPPPGDPARPGGRGPSLLRTGVGVCVLALLAATLLTARGRSPGEPVKLVPIGTTSVQVRPSLVSFGDIEVGTTSKPEEITLTVKGPGPFTGRGASVQGDEFALLVDGCAGQVYVDMTCRVTVAFTPRAVGDRQGLVLVDGAEGRVDAALRGTGRVAASDERVVSPTSTGGARDPGGSTSVPGDTTTTAAPPQAGALHADRSTVDFGEVPLGTTSPAARVVLRNTGTVPLRITGVSVAGPAAGDFKVTDGCRTSPLQAGRSCDASVTFTPGAVGPRAGGLAVAAEGSPGLTVALAGAGTGARLVIDPVDLDFGEVPLGGESKAQVLTVRNTGNAVTTSTATNVDFPASIVSSTCTKPLEPDRACQLALQFTPRALGPVSGRVTVAGASARLSGTGMPVADLSVRFCASCGDPFSVQVTNGGPHDATDVRIRLTGAVPAKAPGSCSTSNGVTSCVLGTVPADTTVPVPVDFVGGSGEATAAVSSREHDPKPGNNSTSVGVPG